MKKFKLFINNEWVDSSDKKTFITSDPCIGEPIAQLASATKEDVEKAVAAAKKTFDSGVWSELDPGERAEYMLKACRIMERRLEELAKWEARDTGKTLRECRDVDLPYSIRAMEFHAIAAQTLKGEVVHIPGKFAFDYVTYEPYGVVASISPWNFPLHLMTRSICPALAAGNTIVSKASTLTPVTTQIMGEIFEEADFPAGVVNIVSGPGSVVGEALLAAKDVSVVAFTGSEAVGRQLMLSSSKSKIIKKLILELGGKGAFIAEPDCDVDAAVNGLIAGFCLNQGEVCCASSRVYIHEDIYDKFIEKLVDRCKSFKLGNQLDSDTMMGALIDKNQYKTVSGYVDAAIQSGAKALCGAKRLTGGIYDKGYFYPPTVLADVNNSMPCVQEEIFGPVLVAQKYKTLEEAIRLANDTNFGLGATIYSENPRTLYWAAKKLDAGTVWMNCNVMSKIEAPFGGNKNSGLGREDGIEGLKEYMKVKNNILYVGAKYDNFFGF